MIVVVAAPECYEDLLDLFGEHSHDDCLVIIDRLRKCHHPSLAEGNKAKLEVCSWPHYSCAIFSRLCRLCCCYTASAS